VGHQRAAGLVRRNTKRRRHTFRIQPQRPHRNQGQARGARARSDPSQDPSTGREIHLIRVLTPAAGARPATPDRPGLDLSGPGPPPAASRDQLSKCRFPAKTVRIQGVQA